MAAIAKLATSKNWIVLAADVIRQRQDKTCKELAYVLGDTAYGWGFYRSGINSLPGIRALEKVLDHLGCRLMIVPKTHDEGRRVLFRAEDVQTEEQLAFRLNLGDG